MKKILGLLVLIFAFFILVACEETNNEEPKDTTKPLLNGVVDTNILVGSTFDKMLNVTASDDTDGDITSKIIVTGEVNTEVAAVYTLNYEVSDNAKNKTAKERKVTVVEETVNDLQFRNGDFTRSLTTGWTHWSGEGGASTASIIQGQAVIDVTKNGTYWYSTQFSHPGLNVTQGKMYRIEFEARADVPRSIAIKLEDPSYFGYIDETVMLTTTMTKYKFDFFVTKPSITNGKLVIGVGNMAARGEENAALTKVYLDNFVGSEIEAGEDTGKPVISGVTPRTISVNDPFNPLEGITVSDDRDITLTPSKIVITGIVDVTKAGVYKITYSLTDQSGNKVEVEREITVVEGLTPSTLNIINGDFETEQLTALAQPASTGWGWHGGGVFKTEIKDGVAKTVISNIGTVVHGVQFYQQNREITQGQIYKITFDGKSDIPRPIMFALEENTTRKYDEIFNLTDEWQTFEIYYEHVLTSFTNGKFAFFMGDIGDDSVPTTVYLDNITVETVEELVDVNAPHLMGMNNYTVGKNSVFNPLTGVTIVDNLDKTLTLEDIEVTGLVNTEVIGSYTLTYKIKDSSDNENTYTRVISVVEPGEIRDTTFTLVNGDFETEQLTALTQPATTGWGWHGTGKFTIEIKNGIATIVVTDPGTVPHGVQFYQQNRVIESGATYLLKYRAKVDIARSMRISLEAGTDVKFFKVVDVTTEWVNYEVLISITGGGFTTGKFAFFPGYIDETSVATTFYLDNVSLELVGQRTDIEKPMILGTETIEIVKGSEFKPEVGMYVFDAVDKTLTTASMVVTQSVDENTVGTYEVIYKLTDSSGNFVEFTRTVKVIEPAPAE